MAHLTWYVLDTLDMYLELLKAYAASQGKPIFLIHLLATYKKGVQKYGADKFTTYDEILNYYNLRYLESGVSQTALAEHPNSQNTYFLAQVNP